jgi:hypothetical protein
VFAGSVPAGEFIRRFDLTKPLIAHGKDFNRAPFPNVDLSKFLK